MYPNIEYVGFSQNLLINGKYMKTNLEKHYKICGVF